MFKWLLLFCVLNKKERNNKGQFVKGHTYIPKKGKKHGRTSN